VNRVYPPRRKLWTTTALLGVLIAIGVTLTQCKMVTDELSGVRMSQTESVKSCLANCMMQYNALIRVESELHVVNIKACGTDAVCIATEDARHDAAVAVIQTARTTCQDGCHHQGAGSGGR
jgi:hypothetical protein